MEGSLDAAVMWAAIAGGVAWVVFTLLPDVWRAARGPVAGVAALMGALNGLSRADLTPINANRVERELLASDEVGDLARAFRDADPLGFAAYVEQVRVAISEDEDPQAMLLAAMMIGQAAEARLALGPAENIVAYFELQRDEYLAMSETNPSLCRRVYFGEAVSTAELPNHQAIQQRRLNLYELAFAAPANQSRAAMTDTELQDALTRLHETTAAIVGSDYELLSLDIDATGREARSCEIIAAFVNELAQSPDAPLLFVSLREPQTRPS